MNALTQAKCVPCEGGTLPLTPAQFDQYLKAIVGWNVIEDKKIEKDFKFKDFQEALQFVNRVGKLAQSEGHHPDIFLHNWRRVRLTLTTHVIGGLSINDFIMAAKTDQLFSFLIQNHN